jgi:hypothetical protein
MANKPYIINYSKTADCSLSTIEELVESGIQQGWKTSGDGDTSGLLYNGPLNDYTLQWHPRKKFSKTCRSIGEAVLHSG